MSQLIDPLLTSVLGFAATAAYADALSGDADDADELYAEAQASFMLSRTVRRTAHCVRTQRQGYLRSSHLAQPLLSSPALTRVDHLHHLLAALTGVFEEFCDPTKDGDELLAINLPVPGRSYERSLARIHACMAFEALESSQLHR